MSPSLKALDAANLAKRENCPNKAAHIGDDDMGYLQWHAWARRMAKKHRQLRCDGCGLYVIWQPRIACEDADCKCHTAASPEPQGDKR